MTEQAKFAARIEEKREREGLVDIKFLVEQGETIAKEEFFSAANRIEDALDDKQFEETNIFRATINPSHHGGLNL